MVYNHYAHQHTNHLLNLLIIMRSTNRADKDGATQKWKQFGIYRASN